MPGIDLQRFRRRRLLRQMVATTIYTGLLLAIIGLATTLIYASDHTRLVVGFVAVVLAFMFVLAIFIVTIWREAGR